MQRQVQFPALALVAGALAFAPSVTASTVLAPADTLESAVGAAVADTAGAPVSTLAPATLGAWSTPPLMRSVGRAGRLHRHASALPPADGLLLVGLRCGMFSLEPPARDVPYPVRVWDWRLQVGYGPWPGVRLEIELPYRRWSGTAGAAFPSGGSGVGDLQVGLQTGLPFSGRRLAWAAWGGASLPVGDRASALGEAGVSPQAGASLALRFWTDTELPEARLHLGAGRRWNHDDSGRATEREAGRYAPWPPLYPAVEAGGSAGDNDFLLLTAGIELRKGITSLFVEYSEARLPWAGGVAGREQQRFLTSGLHWGGDEGWGLSTAYDVCLSRDDLGTSFTADYPDLIYHLEITRAFALGGRDRDHDGVPDRRDACPGQPEDRDGWRDDDGCPDLDNDGDGVPDANDGCPDQPEDRDGWQDQDGCPEEDNDGDGIADRRDACPDLAEDFDGHQDADGCPEEFKDRDGDGIPDERDRCPDNAEDSDGFEDGDGCPDPDNDLDGLDDALDACPDAPEDYDGVDDDDGCPDVPASGGTG